MEGNSRKSTILPYHRERAVEYARYWALKRNPEYLDFEKFGGDCTNFASQVLLAGSRVMNYAPVYGWYYINSYTRTASWTGVSYLYDFLVHNQGPGPFAEEVDIKDIQPGDLIQLAFNDSRFFQHTPVVLDTGLCPEKNNILVAAHTDDQVDYLLTGYNWVGIRFLHLLGVRT